MSNRARICSVLEGQAPDRIPLGIYEEFVDRDPLWSDLVSRGLTVISEAPTFREVRSGLEIVRRREPWRDEEGERLIYHTSVGEISQFSVRGWVQEYFLRTPKDYRVMTHIVKNTRVQASPELFLAKQREAGDAGFTFHCLGRSPMQTMLVDYAGLEQFSYHLGEGFPELFELYEALTELLLQRCRVAAAGPGRYVSLLENLTAEQCGPRRFARYHLPVYAKMLPIMHAGGKKVYAHFDGQLACLAGLIAETDLDGIESLTGPPEGDMTYAQARAAWPDKVFWGNINVGAYDLPPDLLRRRVSELARQAAPDRRNLILEVSEDLPVQWRESLPIVLEALESV